MCPRPGIRPATRRSAVRGPAQCPPALEARDGAPPRSPRGAARGQGGSPRRARAAPPPEAGSSGCRSARRRDRHAHAARHPPFEWLSIALTAPSGSGRRPEPLTGAKNYMPGTYRETPQDARKPRLDPKAIAKEPDLGQPGGRGIRLESSWPSIAAWCDCAPTTIAESSSTDRAGSGPTRSSGATKRCRPAPSTRSRPRTGSSRPTASPPSACSAGCRRRRSFSWWRGHPDGWWNPRDWRIASITVPVGSHLPHAAGMAWGLKLRGHSACVLAFFGDGATSTGAFHEGMTFAASKRVPAVLLCNSSSWAISTPTAAQSGAERLVDKAVGYGDGTACASMARTRSRCATPCR